MKSDSPKTSSITLVIMACALALLAAAGTAAAEEAVLKDMSVAVENGELLFSTVVQGEPNENIEEAVKSGAPVTFTFLVKLSRIRGLWFDKGVAERKLQNTVKYDHLKEEFTVTHSWDEGRTVVVTSFDKAMEEMRRIDGAPLCETDLLEKEKRYVVAAKAELEKLTLPLYLHYVFFFVSLWDVETPWQEIEFTFSG